MSFRSSRTVPPPPAYIFLSVRGEKHATVSRLYQSTPHSPPLKKKKNLLRFPPREIPSAQARHPISILGRDSRGERKDPAVATAMLQPGFYEQDIPKQLEGADIWCCALVLGPPQNGPVKSGNLVIFSASLAALQL